MKRTMLGFLVAVVMAGCSTTPPTEDSDAMVAMETTPADAPEASVVPDSGSDAQPDSVGPDAAEDASVQLPDGDARSSEDASVETGTDGALVADSAPEAAVDSCVSGACLSFNARGTTPIVVANPTTLTPRSITISMRVKLQADDMQQFLFQRKTHNSGGVGIVVFYTGSGTTPACPPHSISVKFPVNPCTITCANADFVEVCSGDLRADGRWRNVVATYDASTANAELYVENTRVAFATAVICPSSGGDMGLKYLDSSQPITIGAETLYRGLRPSAMSRSNLSNIVILDHPATLDERNELRMGTFNLCNALAGWRLNDRSSVVRTYGTAGLPNGNLAGDVSMSAVSLVWDAASGC